MAFVRFSLGAYLVLGFATACSSSSTAPGGPADASTSGEDAGDGSAPLGTCGLLGMVTGGGSGSCPSGQTCCTVLALPPSSSCVAASACAGGISTQCSMPTDCTGGQVCCAGSADAGPLPADGGMPTFDPSSLSTTCQASCAASQAQYCAVDADCPTGLTCQTLPIGGGLGGFIKLPNFCAAPPVDAGVVVNEAGAVVDSGSSPPDAGTADAPAE